jgi:hypothetical protein
MAMSRLFKSNGLLFESRSSGMQEITPLGWASIICIGFIFLILNIGLVGFLRYKPAMKIKPRKTNDLENLNRTLDVLKDPFHEERDQLKELSGLVEKLHSKSSDPDQNEPSK